jgi:uncharacterized protein GlcG (DUF336 family)
MHGRGQHWRRARRGARPSGHRADRGGLPIVVNNRMIGAIGISGGTGAQDGQVAKVGLEALK